MVVGMGWKKMTEINLPKFRGENHGDLPILEANGFLHGAFVGANI